MQEARGRQHILHKHYNQLIGDQTPFVEENEAKGRQQIFTNPQDNLKATQPHYKQEESAGNPWELDRPKYKHPKGSVTISSENALVRAMGQE